jgi:hypothetical protein
MCTPAAITSVIIGGAQTVSSIAGQRQQAEMQQQAQNLAAQQERERYLAEVAAMRTREQQEMVAKAQRIDEASRRAQEVRARATVAAGESGISGLSVNALINDLARQEQEYIFSEKQQASMTDVANQMRLKEAGLGFNRNMLRIRQPIEQPDYLGTAIGGIQTGLSTFNTLSDAGFNQEFKKFTDNI